MSEPTPDQQREIEAMVKTTIAKSRTIREVALSELETLERNARQDAARSEQQASLRAKGRKPWWKLFS